MNNPGVAAITRRVKIFLRRVDRTWAVRRGAPDIGCDQHVAMVAKRVKGKALLQTDGMYLVA